MTSVGRFISASRLPVPSSPRTALVKDRTARIRAYAASRRRDGENIPQGALPTRGARAQCALACRPIRDLLVDYLSERHPRLDYSSLRSLAADLGNVFWKDLERHHPGIDNLDLAPEVATSWKQRLRTRQKTVTTRAPAKSWAGWCDLR